MLYILVIKKNEVHLHGEVKKYFPKFMIVTSFVATKAEVIIPESSRNCL